MQCVRTKTSGGNHIDSSVCKTGGYETQCLSDDTSMCGFTNKDGTSSLGECEAQYVSAEGAALGLNGLTLILVIALPIGGCCLLLCLVLIVVCICRKKAAADEASSVAKAIALLQRSSVAKAVAGEKDPKKIDVKIRTFV